MKTSTLEIKIDPDTSRVAEAARVVAKHLTAMADELDALRGDDFTRLREHPGYGETVTGTEHPADGTWSPPLSNDPAQDTP